MTHNKQWFEMSDVISNRHGDGEWTLLWAYEVLQRGDQFSAPYLEAILRVRSVFAPLLSKEKWFSRWYDIETDNVYPCVDHGQYCKPYVYYFDSTSGDEAGEYGVYSYRITSGETSGLIVNPDMVAALGLVQEGDHWIRPSECDVEVIKVERDSDGKIITIKIKTEHLKDYLCARRMGLYIEEFRHRQEQDFDGNKIDWDRSPIIDKRFSSDGNGIYEWKGWMFKHIDDYSWNDVQTVKGPVLSLPSYYRIEGQLWKQFWVNPAKISSRVAGDEINLSFYVKPNGEQHEISTVDDFEYGHVYLFFNIGLVDKLRSTGLTMTWVARDVFKVTSPNGPHVLCGISKKGNIFAISADVARQDTWLQMIYRSENIRPEELNDYAGCELFQNQMMCEFLSTKAPEDEFKRLVKDFDNVFLMKTGVRLWKDCNERIINLVSRFASMDVDGYVRLAKILTEGIIERIDEKSLVGFINGRVKTDGFRGISLLGVCVNLLNTAIDGKIAVKFLRDINSIRQVDAHYMPPEDVQQKLSVLPWPGDMPFVERGARLIDYVNQGLERLIQILH